MDIGGLISIGRRWLLALVLAALGGGILGFAYSSSATPVFEARTRLLVGPINADASTLRAAGQTSQTYAELAGNDAVLERAVAGLGLDARALRAATVTARASDITRFLKITVRHEDPEEAAAIANAIAAELNRIADSEPASATGGQVGDITIIEPASVPGSPVSPDIKLISVLGAMAGLVAAAAIVLGIEYRQNRIHTPEDVEALTGSPVVSRILAGTRFSDGGRRPDSWNSPHSATALSFRGLAVEVASSRPRTGEGASVLVVGTEPGDRSGDVAVNLAVSLGQLGTRVALVDATADLSLRAFIIDLEATTVSPTVFEIRGGDLVPVLDPGRPGRNGGRMTSSSDSRSRSRRTGHTNDGSATIVDRISRLEQRFDFVVVHPSPVVSTYTPLLWAPHCTSTLMVITRSRARADLVVRSTEALSRTAADFPGLILDERPRAKPRPSPTLPTATRAEPSPNGGNPAKQPKPSPNGGKPESGGRGTSGSRSNPPRSGASRRRVRRPFPPDADRESRARATAKTGSEQP